MENGAAPETPKPKWWWSTPFVIFALLSAGPFALPLLWFNPRYSAAQKVLWTLVTAIATYALVVASLSVFKTFMQQARDLGLIQ